MPCSFLHPKSPGQAFECPSVKNGFLSVKPTLLFPSDCALRKVRFFSQLLSFLPLAHSFAKTAGVVLVFLVKNPIPFSEFPSLIFPPPLLLLASRLPAVLSAEALAEAQALASLHPQAKVGRSPRSHLLSITSALSLLTGVAQLPSFQCLPHSFSSHGGGHPPLPFRPRPSRNSSRSLGWGEALS